MWDEMKTRHFFNNHDKQRIISAIEEAEKLTSGEIRVHVESKAGEDIFARAKAVFESLGMAKTELHNGVLIYLATQDHKFAIIGDKGIDQKVPPGFWDDTKEKIQSRFKEGQFAEGVCVGIKLAGQCLAEYFPCQPGDVNELSNEISLGK